MISRRFLLCGTAALAVRPAWPDSANEHVYRFATVNCDIRLSVEFYDRYSSRGFWFQDDRSSRQFCLSGKGEEAKNCLVNFAGSVAVARYKIRPRSGAHTASTLREHVRTIDQDVRVKSQPPYNRDIELRQGVASDIQAFGYETAAASSAPPPVRAPEIRDPKDPWCFFRQDLYLDAERSPFLVIHWRHALNAIRILDIIPGEQTWPVED